MVESESTKTSVPLFASASAWSVFNILYHARVDYLSSARRGTYGLFITLIALVLALALVLRAQQRTPIGLARVAREGGWAWLTLLVASFLLYLRHIRMLPLFLDEAYWIQTAKGVLQLRFIDPAGFVGDQPADFQAWPVAFLLMLIGDTTLAVRLTGTLFFVGTTLLLSRLLAVRRRRVSMIFGMLFWAFSLWSVHMSIWGWNNVSIVPLLTVWQLCRFLEAKAYGCERSLLWCGVGGGVAIATLYVPMMLTGLLVPAVLFSHRTFSKRARLYFFVVLLLVAGSTVGKCIRYPRVALGRHAELFEGRRVPNQPRLLQTYKQTIAEFWRDLKPDSLRDPMKLSRFRLWGVYLELTTVVFLALGIIAVFAAKQEGRDAAWLLAATVWMFVAIVISNPGTSVYREAGMQPLLCAIAGFGVAFLIDSLRRFHLPRRALAIALGCIVVSHLAVFARLYFRYEDSFVNRTKISIESTSELLVGPLSKIGQEGYVVALPVSIAATLVRASLPDQEPTIVEYRTAEELLNSGAEKPAVAVALLPELQDDVTMRAIESQVLSVSGAVTKRTTRDSQERIRAIFLLPPRRPPTRSL